MAHERFFVDDFLNKEILVQKNDCYYRINLRMAENSAFANLNLNCPKNPRKEEKIVLERTLAKKEVL
jgi:hypothetical protein